MSPPGFDYFDAHCDTLTALGTGSCGIRVDFAKEEFFRRAQIFAVCADVSESPEGLLEACAKRLSEMEGVSLCRDIGGLEAAQKEGRAAAFLSVEGAEVIGCDPARLPGARALGVCMIGLTWNIPNGLAGTCVAESEQGLTPKGILFAKKALDCGMALDISHISDRAAYELICLAPGRVLASHSNARAVCENPRNIDDGLFRELASAGGVCGINLYSPFLAEGRPAQISDILAHIEHFCSLFPSAHRHIALGCDFDGCDSLPEGISSPADLWLLAEALGRANYGDGLIDGFFAGNLKRFVKQAFPMPGAGLAL